MIAALILNGLFSAVLALLFHVLGMLVRAEEDRRRLGAENPAGGPWATLLTVSMLFLAQLSFYRFDRFGGWTVVGFCLGVCLYRMVPRVHLLRAVLISLFSAWLACLGFAASLPHGDLVARIVAFIVLAAPLPLAVVWPAEPRRAPGRFLLDRMPTWNLRPPGRVRTPPRMRV